jgi:hypothetical protein
MVLVFFFSPDEPAFILIKEEETILLILPQAGHISITKIPFYNYANNAPVELRALQPFTDLSDRLSERSSPG